MPSRERTYRTEAIVLRRKDIGEADRILTLLTPGRGKIRAVAKGIRKPRSRKAGHLELFTRTKLLLAVGRDLDIITQAEVVDAYRPLRENLLRGAYAAYMVELLDRFIPDEQENAELYDLLRQGLTWAGAAADLALAARYYELHLLSMAGYQPQLRECVICGNTLQAEDQYFSPAEGGVVCPRCVDERPGAQASSERERAGAQASSERERAGGPAQAGWMPLSLAALKLLRYTQSNTFAKVAALNVGARTQAEVEFLLARYITLILERQLKSIEFLMLIRRAEAPPAAPARLETP